MPKVAVFIDHGNVYKTIRTIKKGDSSWSCLYNPLELAKKLAGNRDLIGVHFYCVRPPVCMMKEDQWHQDVYALTNKYYSAIEKLPSVYVKYGILTGGRKFLKEKNVDTQLVGDLITGAALNDFDVAIIVSNDGDYLSAVINAKKFGKKIEGFYFKGFLSMNLAKVYDLKRRARKSHFLPLDLGEDTSCLEVMRSKRNLLQKITAPITKSLP